MKGSDFMSALVIAEKPSMARQIAAVLGATEKNNGYVSGNNYIVSWCFGHLAGLAEPETYTEKWSGKWSFDQLPMIPDNTKVVGHMDKSHEIGEFQGFRLSVYMESFTKTIRASLKGEAHI